MNSLFKLTLSTASLATLLAVNIHAQSDSTATAPVEQPPTHSLSVGTGFDYSRGDYGLAEDTEFFSIPANLTYEIPHWIFRASIPFTTITGPAEVVSGVTRPGGGGPRRDADSESGIGDATVSATYMLGPVLGPVSMDLTARLKLPTADEKKGLGTGATDKYLQADFYRVIDRYIPFATAGYRFLGDSDRYELENGAYASAGLAYLFTDATRAGVSFDWRQRIIEGGDSAVDVGVFVAHAIGREWNLIGYAVKGTTDASADISIGGSLTYRF